MTVFASPARIFFLLLLASAAAAQQEASLQNNGRFGPVTYPLGKKTPLRLAEERLTLEVGKKETRVKTISRFVNDGDAAFQGSLAFLDLAQAWRLFEEEQARLSPENKMKWTDPKNPFYHYPFSPLKNPMRLGGDFTGKLEDAAITVNGKAAAPVAAAARLAVSTGTFWVVTDSTSGFPMSCRVLKVSAEPRDEILVERTFRTRNTAYLGGVDVNLFDYEVLAGRGQEPEILGVDVFLKDGLAIDHLKWQGLNQEDTRHMLPGRRDWTAIGTTTLRLYWVNPFEDRGRNLLRVALDTEWVDSPPEGRPVHSNLMRFVKFVKTPRGEPVVIEATREYFSHTFRVKLLPTAVVSDADKKRLRSRKIKTGAPLEVQGFRTAFDEITVKDGTVFKLK